MFHVSNAENFSFFSLIFYLSQGCQAYLMDVDMQLNQIICDPFFTNCLTLLRVSFKNVIYPLADAILDRFCLQILPEIHDNVKWLNVESLSMKRVFLAAKYSNLYGLGIYNIEEETAQRFFAGKKFNFSRFNH
jgi:hypothetical protein